MYTVENENGNIYTFLHMVKSAGTSIHRSFIESSKITHVNQRHAHIRNLPEIYKEYPKIIVIRKPEDWYQSFYRYFLGVEGYLSFMLNDPKEPIDGYIYPISLDEFARRGINLKVTLLKYPNKARVFNNLLRSQSHMHFITGYFEHALNINKPETYEQFNATLYKWFWKSVGGEEAIFIPMNRLDVVEKLFKIKIPHINKTSDEKPKENFSPRSLKLIRRFHKEFYDMYNEFDENNLRTYQDFKEGRDGIGISKLC